MQIMHYFTHITDDKGILLHESDNSKLMQKILLKIGSNAKFDVFSLKRKKHLSKM